MAARLVATSADPELVAEVARRMLSAPTAEQAAREDRAIAARRRGIKAALRIVQGEAAQESAAE